MKSRKDVVGKKALIQACEAVGLPAGEVARAIKIASNGKGRNGAISLSRVTRDRIVRDLRKFGMACLKVGGKYGKKDIVFVHPKRIRVCDGRAIANKARGKQKATVETRG